MVFNSLMFRVVKGCTKCKLVVILWLYNGHTVVKDYLVV